MINEIKMKLYQLVDTSTYISELSNKLCKDYDYYSNLLILACVEEKYLLKQLESDLDNYLNINNSKWSFFKRKTRISIEEDGWEYCFKLPKLDKYSREYVELDCVFNEVKVMTHDFNSVDIFLKNRKMTLFRLECRHRDFDTDKYLQMKNVRITYNIY